MTSSLQQQVRHHLEALARDKKTISYRLLAEQVGIPSPQTIRRLTGLLEAIIREDHAAGISASVACLAVSQAQPAIPRAGFFILLIELGIYKGTEEGEEAEAFHAALLEQVFARDDQR